jgi:hypothetical protein
MFVLSPRSPHIPYPRFDAALRAGDLGFIRCHRAQISLSLFDEADVCQLIAEQDPENLEAARVQWISRFTAEANHARPGAYQAVLEAFEGLLSDPEPAVARLKELCVTWGLGR